MRDFSCASAKRNAIPARLMSPMASTGMSALSFMLLIGSNNVLNLPRSELTFPNSLLTPRLRAISSSVRDSVISPDIVAVSRFRSSSLETVKNCEVKSQTFLTHIISVSTSASALSDFLWRFSVHHKIPAMRNALTKVRTLAHSLSQSNTTISQLYHVKKGPPKSTPERQSQALPPPVSISRACSCPVPEASACPSPLPHLEYDIIMSI